MKNRFLKYIAQLFIQPYDGTHGRLANQLIYSQLKNRLVMMTQKPSSMLAKWKYSGVLPLLLLALLVFSFRTKERQQNLPSDSTHKVYNIYKDGLKVYGFDNTEPPLFPGCEKVNEMEKADC